MKTWKQLMKNVRVKRGEYVAFRRIRKLGRYMEVISNFTIRIVGSYKKSNKIIREVVFVSEFGKESQPFPIQSNRFNNNGLCFHIQWSIGIQLVR